MNISVIGTGYVGLVVGVCFSETGHQVVCIDQDRKKIEMLRAGGVPIYEPGLEDLLKRNMAEGRLSFATDLKAAVERAEMVFICVGTPSRESGEVDLTAVYDVARSIGEAMNNPKIVVMKSTTPCGTSREVEKILKERTKVAFDVVVNPEFLKEGVAIDDFMRPDRVIVGVEREELKSTFRRLYEPFLRTGKPLIFMSRASAEMAKYAANGLLALRISYMNEIANLCDALGADVESVRKGIGADARIGFSFLFPGVGFGGSCFPKDISALISTAEKAQLPFQTLRAAAEVNLRQKHVLAQKIKRYFERQGAADLKGKKIAVWGLAFKPQTDDMREAPAVSIIEDLVRAGATVAAFDPVAMPVAKEMFAAQKIPVDLARTAYAACEKADALALVTEWNEFRRPDFKKLKELMAHPAIFDGRNILDSADAQALGFHYEGVGRNPESVG